MAVLIGKSTPAARPGRPHPYISQGDAVNNKIRALDTRRKVGPALDTPTDLTDDAGRELSATQRAVRTDIRHHAAADCARR
jgi:hypothetical protein